MKNIQESWVAELKINQGVKNCIKFSAFKKKFQENKYSVKVCHAKKMLTYE